MRLLPDHDLTGWTTLQALTATNYLNEFVDGQAVRCCTGLSNRAGATKQFQSTPPLII